MALTRKKITVRGKNGKTFQRSVMVRAGEAVKRTAGKVGRFVNKHKGKIAAVAGAAALAGGLAYAHKKGHINLGGMASNARHAAGTAAGAARAGASRVAGAAKAGASRVAGAARSAAEGVRARHAEGMARARSGVKAASHPDREAQGKSRGRVAQAVAAVKGYARGTGVSGAARGAANSVRGAAEYATKANAKTAANNVRTAAANVVARGRSAVANYKAGRTRKRTTLQLGSGS